MIEYNAQTGRKKADVAPESKAAIARILSDLVKSDNVISLSELNSLESYFKQFNIDGDDRERGFGMTLQDAFEVLQTENNTLKNAVEEAMKNISGADNECCRAEDMLITAYRYAVKGKGARVYSMLFRNRPILDSQILFIENRSERDRKLGGDLLRDCHEQISNIVEAAGFDLVYIPEIKRRLNAWDSIKGKGNLERVFRLISPVLAKDEVATIVERAKGLTTRSFYEEVLCSEEGLQMPLEISKPSWMVRLCNSTLNGRGYANFMCFELDFDADSREERDTQIRRQIHNFVDDLNALQGSYSIVVNRHKAIGEDFQYGGFYKVLFDVLLGKKTGSWSLYICPGRAPREYMEGTKAKRCQLYLMEDGRKYWIPLTGMDAALYALIICMSVENGAGLNPNSYNTVQRLFETVYLHTTTKDTDEAPDITVPGTFRQVKFRINKVLSSIQVINSHGLQMDQDGGFLKVRVDPANIRVGQDTPLLDSDLYKAFKRALKA